MIKFEDFQKLDLRVARIIEAEEIEGSEKLVLLKIDIGKETRQIVAGVKNAYRPQDLAGREIVVVLNLEPRKLMGFQSQGMLLAAVDDNGKPVLLVPEKEVKPGSEVK